jgi:PAP2 superfamily
MIKQTLFSLAAGVCLAGCGRNGGDYRTQPPDPELLHTAVNQVTGVIVYDIFSPPQAARVYAYASVAAYEALRPEYAAKYKTLAGQLNGLTPAPAPTPNVQYYLPLSSVHAFMTVGKALTFSSARMDSLRKAMDERFRHMGIPAPVVDSSIAYGDRVAQHILTWSKADHYLQTRGMPKYTVTPAPGRWVPTPPAYMDAVEPNWGMLRPFVMDSAGQIRPKPPFAFDTAKTSPYLRQVKEVFQTRTDLSEEQRAIAAFWDCNPYVMHVQGHAMFATKKITPGGHWMGIVGIAARKSGADLMQSAEAYARTSVALADAFMSAWSEKFRSNAVRPETVINAYMDESWEPLLQTPPFPEYPSAHSVISNAAAAVLTDEFGPGFVFTDDTEAAYGLPARSFSSFREAAAEAAISRMYGGIHYRRAVEEGSAQGLSVGQLVLKRIHTRVTGANAEAPAASNGEQALANLSGH